MPKYDHTQAGHVCRHCDANYLHWRPWRWNSCQECYRERLPGIIFSVALGFTLGLLAVATVAHVIGYCAGDLCF